ncbi:MAG: restriction endonuclease subunit S [Ruminococcus sp.]|nr:restriction endonuclease subunit S [Ruminococcus sp.]
MIWKKSELSKISRIGDGAHASLKRIDFGIPYLTAKNITKSGIDYSNMDYISEGIYNKHFKEKSNALTKPKKDDILYSIIGSIGGVYVVRDEKIGISSSVAIFRADINKVLPQYLAYFLKSPSFDAQVQAIKGGVAQGFMSLGKLGTVNISYPDDIEYQNRIIDILSSYDDLIENNQKQIKLLEEAAQRLYKEWFVDLRFPGHEDVEIVDGVPEEWNKELIGNIIGKVSRTKQIKTADYLLEGSIPIIDQSRDFIAGYTNENDAIVNVGVPVIVFGDHTRILKYIQFPFAKGADGTQLIISDRDNMPQSLLYLSLIAVDLSNYHYARHFKYLKAESVLVPTQKIADEFDRLVSPMFNQVQKLRDKCNKLSQARDRLLPKLMSGEIEV